MCRVFMLQIELSVSAHFTPFNKVQLTVFYFLSKLALNKLKNCHSMSHHYFTKQKHLPVNYGVQLVSVQFEALAT